MNSANPQTSRQSTPYHCSSCSRCFIAFRDAAEGELVCACGAVLAPGSLPRGIYELRSPIPDDSRATNPSSQSNPSGIPKEPDLGYGKSHGYGPAHGGPTGPGDAPAGGDDDLDFERDKASGVRSPGESMTDSKRGCHV
jgi:hypothetical protein